MLFYDMLSNLKLAQDDGTSNGGDSSTKNNSQPPKKIKKKHPIKKIIVGILAVAIIGGATWGAIDYSKFKTTHPDANFGSYISYQIDNIQDKFEESKLNNFFDNMSETENVFEGATEAEYEDYYAEMSEKIVKRYFQKEVGNVPSDFNQYKIEYMTNTKDGIKLYMTACNSNSDDHAPIWKATADYNFSEMVLTTLNSVKDYDILRHLNFLTDHIAPSNKTMCKLEQGLDDIAQTRINDIIKNNSRTIPNYMMGEVYGVWEVNESAAKVKALWSTNAEIYTIFTIDLNKNYIFKNGDVFSGWSFMTTSDNVDTNETQANMGRAQLFQYKIKNANDFENITSNEQ